jgi:hypothetical protein
MRGITLRKVRCWSLRVAVVGLLAGPVSCGGPGGAEREPGVVLCKQTGRVELDSAAIARVAISALTGGLSRPADTLLVVDRFERLGRGVLVEIGNDYAAANRAGLTVVGRGGLVFVLGGEACILEYYN